MGLDHWLVKQVTFEALYIYTQFICIYPLYTYIYICMYVFMYLYIICMNLYIYISIIMMSLNHDVQFARQSSSESLAGSLSRQTSLSDLPDLVARTSVDVVGAPRGPVQSPWQKPENNSEKVHSSKGHHCCACEFRLEPFLLAEEGSHLN